MTALNIYTVSMGYGLYVVRAIDEDDARAVAHAGPSLDKHTHAASQYCAEFDPDAAVQLVAPGGPRGVIDSHYG